MWPAALSRDIEIYWVEKNEDLAVVARVARTNHIKILLNKGTLSFAINRSYADRLHDLIRKYKVKNP